jgi:hypothetical protein
MSITRQELIAKYEIKESGLKNLLEALCEKPEEGNNLTIIKNALNGSYSNLGSRYRFPTSRLKEDLEKAGYTDLVKNFEERLFKHDFNHNFPPRLSVTHPDYHKIRWTMFGGTLNTSKGIVLEMDNLVNSPNNLAKL